MDRRRGSVNQTVHLVDCSLYVFRAWHSVPGEFFDHEGAPVNAVYGFTRFLCDFVEQAKPTHAIAAFDESLTSSFRNAIYPQYKANRELPPEELKRQFTYCKEIAAALGFCVLSDQSYEADDLIGSVLECLRPQGFRAVIVSADKDFGQLIGEHDEQWDFAKQYSWGPAGVHERFGVHPHQIVDFLALTGDTSDNIPGVPGIGAKGAAALLAHFGSLADLLARVEEIPYLRLRGAAASYARLKAHCAQALLSQQLARIALDAPVPSDPHSMRWRGAELAELESLFDRLKFGPITRARCRNLKPAG
jgi:DNA polymerase I